MAHGFTVLQYDVPLVSIDDGKGFISDGNFKLIHMINISQFEDLIGTFKDSLNLLPTNNYRTIIQYHINVTSERLDLLKGKTTRRRRSINWIGSAFKWIAGTPDADDWEHIMQKTSELKENNNGQYKINAELFSRTNDIIKEVNSLIEYSKNSVKELNVEKIEEEVLQKVLLVRDDVNEIVRSVQMARSGIVNTNLLSRSEINRLLDELNTLPYTNEVEAIEYGVPSIYCNGSTLLYILSIPKVGRTEYQSIITRAPIRNGRQIDLKFKRMLKNPKRIFGIDGSCFRLNNTTVCTTDALKEVKENDCVNALLKGGHAACVYTTNAATIIEAIKEDTIYLSNFKGEITQGNTSQPLSGTFIVQISDEEISIGNRSFTSKVNTNTMILPQVLTKITKSSRKLDVGFLHELNLENIQKLDVLSKKHTVSTTIELAAIIALTLVIYWMWKRSKVKIVIPKLEVTSQQQS